MNDGRGYLTEKKVVALLKSNRRPDITTREVLASNLGVTSGAVRKWFRERQQLAPHRVIDILKLFDVPEEKLELSDQEFQNWCIGEGVSRRQAIQSYDINNSGVMVAQQISKDVATTNDAVTYERAARYMDDTTEPTFARLDGPKVFFASPGDVSGLKNRLISNFYDLKIKVVNDYQIEPFSWEMVVDPDTGLDHSVPAQLQIGLPEPENCRAVVCVFGEQIGTPLSSKYLLKKIDPDFLQPSAEGFYLKPDWVDGDENKKAFPLTGTVFECLSVISANKNGNHPTIPLLLVFIGDKEIYSGGDPLNARWGEQQVLHLAKKSKTQGEFDDWKPRQYRALTQKLSNFIQFLRRHERLINPICSGDEAVEAVRGWLVKVLNYSPIAESPIKGLAFYDEDDHAIFYGRELWIKDALNTFNASWESADRVPLFGIIGGSGAGKSSVLRAGLIHQLKRGVSGQTVPAFVLTANDLAISAEKSDADNITSIFQYLLMKAQDEMGITQALTNACDLLADLKPQAQPRHCLTAMIEALREANKSQLVIGLDQFEELLDIRADENTGPLLGPFFQFLAAALECGSIGIVYTCQPNRLALLEQEPNLQPLLPRAARETLKLPSEREFKRIVEGIFAENKVKNKLPQSVISEFCRRIEALCDEEQHGRKDDGSILPLVSLAIERLYVYAQEKADTSSDKDQQSEGGLASQQKAAAAEPVLDEELGRLLNLSNVISELVEKAVTGAEQAPGMDWSEDVVFTLLHKLLGFDPENEERLDLLTTTLPQKGPGRILAQSLLIHRLLKVTKRDKQRIQLVHQAVVDHWPLAQKWLTKERQLGFEAKSFIFAAKNWDKNGRLTDTESVRDASVHEAKLAARQLAQLTELYAPSLGEEPTELNQILRDYFFAILEAKMTPACPVEGREKTSTHFLLAATYGRQDLLKKYLALDPSVITQTRSDGGNAVYCASFIASLATVNLLLEAGVEVHREDNNGWFALHAAAAWSRPDIFDLLVEYGADLYCAGADNNTVVHLAARNGDVKMLSHLLTRYKLDPNAKADGGWTPLHLACRYGNHETVGLLVNQWHADLKATLSNGTTPFHIACRNGDRLMVSVLLNNSGTDLNAVEDNGWSPLLLAIYNRSPGVVAELLTNPNIDRSARSPQGETVLDLAIKNNYSDSLVALLADPHKLVDVNGTGKDEKTALYRALTHKNVAITELLLNYGAQPDAVSDAQRELTALHIAAKLGETRLLQLLIKAARANINPRTKDDETPLFLALKAKHWDAAQLLLNSGADINAKHVKRGTLFNWAIYQRSEDMVAFLLRNGADTKAVNEHQQTLLHLAARYGSEAIAKQLIAKGASVNAVDINLTTPLHLACEYGHAAMLELLMDSNTSINATDRAGWTPLHLAAQNGHVEIVEILLRHRAAIEILSGEPPLTALQAAAETGQADVIKVLLANGANTEAHNKIKAIPLLLALKNGQYLAASILLQHSTEISEAIKKNIARLFLPHWRHRQNRPSSTDAADHRLAQQLVDMGILSEPELYSSPATSQQLAGLQTTVNKSLVIGSLISAVAAAINRSFSHIDSYPWQSRDTGFKESLRLRLSPIDGKYSLELSTLHVDSCELPWYQAVELIRVRDSRWENNKLAIYYLSHQQQLYRLNGTSPCIHEVNRLASIQLTRYNVIDYLKFFCFFVRGDEGPFYIAEHWDDPMIPKQTSADSIVKGAIRPAEFKEINNSGHFLCDAVVYYSNAIFAAKYAVHGSGMVEMLDDDPIVGDLPGEVDAPIA